MTEQADIDEAIAAARLALLKLIGGGVNSSMTLEYAEAYAWLTNPSQGHGGHGKG